MKLISTGIPGLDKSLNGGFIKPSTIYIVGEPGAGKTTLAMQFLSEGAKNGEIGVYFTTIGEKPIFAQTYLEGFDFFDYSFFEKGLIHTIDISDVLSKGTAQDGISEMIKNVQKFTPSRVVIDPITPLALLEKDEATYRRALFDFFMHMKMWDCTTVLIGESYTREGHEIQVEEYLADTVIVLIMKEEMDRINRYLKILKVRGNTHSSEVLSYTITKDGIKMIKTRRTSEMEILKKMATYLGKV